MARRSAAAARRSSSPASSGPTTREGRRARRALNHLSHGLRSLSPVIPGVESEDDWLAHLEGTVRSLNPVGQMETLLAERVAFKLWSLKRVARFETQLVTGADPIGAAARQAAADAADDETEEDEDDESTGDGGHNPADPDPDSDSSIASLEELDRFDFAFTERARAILHAIDETVFAADDKPVSARDALLVISCVAERTTGHPLDSFAVPGTKDTPLTQFDSWTAGLVRATVRAICQRFNQDPEDQFRWAVSHYRDVVARSTAAYSRSSDDDEDGDDPYGAAGSATPARPFNGLPTTMPLDSSLERLIRYEAHISRELHQTLHTLEVWQSRRLNRRVSLAVATLETSAANRVDSLPDGDFAQNPISAIRNAPHRLESAELPAHNDTN